MLISDAGILKKLRTRLGDVDLPEGKKVFSDNQLISFWYIAKSQSRTIDEDAALNHAFIMALMAQAIIERGRQITVTDNGTTYTPPDVAEAILKVIELELKRLELIKHS